MTAMPQRNELSRACDYFPRGYLREADMSYQRNVAIALMRALTICSCAPAPLIASLPAVLSIRSCLYLLIACDEIAQVDGTEEIERACFLSSKNNNGFSSFRHKRRRLKQL